MYKMLITSVFMLIMPVPDPGCRFFRHNQNEFQGTAGTRAIHMAGRTTVPWFEQPGMYQITVRIRNPE